MSSPHSDSYDAHARKRVGKACDRCRLKKSKCDGASPCSRCKVDNAICVFGERKKSHDKVYPKGYVEMLEQQQSQLVAGIREMYKKLLHGDNWSGSPLPDSQEGYPLTHDILERLDVLHMTGDNPVKSEAFEDDLPRMRERLLEGGAEHIRHRHDSVSSGSEPGLAHSESPHGTPNSQCLSFSESTSRKRSSPSTPLVSQVAPSRLTSKKRHYNTEIQQTEVQSIQQWGDSWESAQVTDLNNFQPDFNLFNSYDTPMIGAFDPLDVNPLTAPVLSTMSQVTMGSWPPQDPDFANFIQSGMPSSYHGPVVPA